MANHRMRRPAEMQISQIFKSRYRVNSKKKLTFNNLASSCTHDEKFPISTLQQSKLTTVTSQSRPTSTTIINVQENRPNSSRRQNWLSQSISIQILSLYLLTYLSFYVTNSNADILIYSKSDNTTVVDSFDDLELFFTPVRIKGISGRIVLSQPEDACSEIKNKVPTSDNNQTSDNWFLLALTGSCYFEKKARNAATAGYKAIIMFSSESRSQWRAVDSNVDIVSILVAPEDGLTLRDNYLNDKGYTARIIPSYQIPIDHYLLPFAVFIIVCLFIMIVFLVFQIIKCARDRRQLQRHRLTTKQLRQLLTTIYMKGSHYDTCAICLEEYVEGEKLRVLPCAHGYHLRCIDPWLTKSRRICPVCKGKVRVAGMSDVSDTESDSEYQNPNRSGTHVSHNQSSSQGMNSQMSSSGPYQQQPQATSSRYYSTTMHNTTPGSISIHSGSSLASSLISSTTNLSARLFGTAPNNRANESTPLLRDNE